MANPDPVGYPTDAPVRPGTSDALTARTIDATVHRPLVRAQETVQALGPRIAQSVSPLQSPVILGLVALTLLFVLIARRLKYQPSALVLSALLVLGLSSFRPMPKWEQTRHMTVRPKTKIQSAPVAREPRRSRRARARHADAVDRALRRSRAGNDAANAPQSRIRRQRRDHAPRRAVNAGRPGPGAPAAAAVATAGGSEAPSLAPHRRQVQGARRRV